jgi:signal recognition particle receptor subunit alpha
VTNETNSGKKERTWGGGGKTGKMSKKQKDALDRSKTSSDASTSDLALREERELEQTRAVYLPEKDEKPMWERDKEESEEFERALQDMSLSNSDDDNSSEGSWKNSYLGSMINTFTGNKVLTEEDLKPVLQEMNQVLQGKNVAQEIADDICTSVGTSLVGHKLASFTRISTVVMDALRDAVQRILTPSASVDVLRQVLDARAEGKVFSAVFVGINGVGKSTSLAKVAYYLKEHGIKVLIAACDTFRSGAVEQLRTHSRCLDAPLFEMGYSKDPANVAGCAIAHAKANGFDCVLIDTAGRMQNNEPLMKSLAKLVTDNDPNLVLFVGEALVGNDGIDQLSMFDRALVNYSPPGKVHRIDGIVLTKFDTIDDKVGAALSMSYKSGQPVTFVGTGQKYIHLKKLNVNVVLKHLFT